MEDVFRTIDDEFSSFTCGFFSCLLIGGGVIGALISGIVADRTKKYITLMKLSVGLSCMVIIALFTVVHLKLVPLSQLMATVASLCAAAGFFGYMTYPLGLDLGIECAFPVTSEATCNGLIIISGHIQAILFLLIIRGLASDTTFVNLPCKFSPILVCVRYGHRSSFNLMRMQLILNYYRLYIINGSNGYNHHHIIGIHPVLLQDVSQNAETCSTYLRSSNKQLA